MKKTIHHITKSVLFISENMTFKILECQIIYIFEARKVYQQTHGQRVMNYAGAIRVPTQSATVCTQTDVSWVGAQPVTREQRPTAPVNSKPVPEMAYLPVSVHPTHLYRRKQSPYLRLKLLLFVHYICLLVRI